MQAILKRFGFYVALALAALGGAFTYHYFSRNVAQADAVPVARPAAPPALSASATPVTTSYVCPMHSHVVQDHPGTCPICGMELVAASTSEHTGVIVDAATWQKLGMRVAAADEKSLTRRIATHGTVAVDQSRITHMSPKYEGWIRKLHVTAVGQRVRAGDVIYEIYSPDLIARQRDYLKVVERRNQVRRMLPDPGATENETLMMLAQEGQRQRLQLFYEDLDAELVQEIESRKEPLDLVPIRAPRDGIVTDIGVREGAFVTSMTNVVSLADLSQVWIDITLYEDQLAWVRDGDEVTVRFADPGLREVSGKLRIASPLLDPQTRTVRARMTVANRGEQLRPGEYADVTVQAQACKSLAVPRTALLRTGTGNLVMRHAGDGRFVPTAVDTGLETPFWVEIRSGLRAGEEVAVNGQFLLAAEASIQDTLARMVSSR